MPLQSDAKHTEGFGVCSNNTLSSQGSAVFYACASGGFSNLYDQSIGDQCYEVYLNVIPCAGGASAGGSSGCPVHSGSSTAASSTSASETSSASSSSTTAPASTLAPVTMHMPVPTAAAPSVPAPIFPVPSGNSSTPAVTGTAVTPPTAPTGTTTAPPTTFTGAADALVAGSKLIAAAAGLAAFILA
ncbi:hypothetical protein MMC21_001636 [Puttea exsequens]|nr:hypothetical protein [Puttea exsequens]